jgi:putative hemolysin
MSSTGIEILVLLSMVLINGVFAMSELAIVSSRKVRLQRWANEGNGSAQTALRLANSPNRFLSTVQIGITLVGIAAGAFGGATLATKISVALSNVPWLANYSEAISVGIIIVTTTYLSLVIGELVPKRLALHNPERIACAVARPMQQLSTIARPLVALLSVSTDFVLRVLGSRSSTEPPMTEEEIKVLFQQATKAGIFAEFEQDMVEGVLQLDDLRVGALMTPRTDVVWLDIADPLEPITQTIINAPHDFFPVCRDNLDDVLGVISAKEFLGRLLNEPALQLKSLLRPPLFVPESIRASALLEHFKQTGVHLAMILDEYGGLQGIVTLNDVVEEIVGEIEITSPQVVQRPDGSWLLDGLLPVDEFKKLFDVRELPGEGQKNYETLGGFVMMHLGRVPSAGDAFRWSKLQFEIMDMDGRRVDKLLVTPLKPKSAKQPPDSPHAHTSSDHVE